MFWRKKPNHISCASRVDEAYWLGYTRGLQKDKHELVKAERERIIKLWDQEMKCECEDPMRHLLTLIKGENK